MLYIKQIYTEGRVRVIPEHAEIVHSLFYGSSVTVRIDNNETVGRVTSYSQQGIRICAIEINNTHQFNLQELQAVSLN